MNCAHFGGTHAMVRRSAPAFQAFHHNTAYRKKSWKCTIISTISYLYYFVSQSNKNVIVSASMNIYASLYIFFYMERINVPLGTRWNAWNAKLNSFEKQAQRFISDQSECYHWKEHARKPLFCLWYHSYTSNNSCLKLLPVYVGHFEKNIAKIQW